MKRRGALIRHGLKLGLAAPIRVVIDFYESLIYILLGWWADPILQEIVSAINALLDWRLNLDPSWKHVYVLMMLFFASFARQIAAASPRIGLINGTFGAIVSLVFSIYSGMTPSAAVNDTAAYVMLNAIIPLFPLMIVGIFFVGAAIWFSVEQARIRGTHWFQNFTSRPAVKAQFRLLIVVGVLVGGWVAGAIGNFLSDILILLPLLLLPRPIVVGVGFVMVAVFFVAWAAWHAHLEAKVHGTTWLYEFRANFWTSVARSMIVVMLGAAVVLAINAGLLLLFENSRIERSAAHFFLDIAWCA